MLAATFAPLDGGLIKLAARLRGLSGKRRAGAAFALGATATAALPPIDALPLVVIAFTGLAWLVEGAERGRSAVAIGWWFGFGHFVTGLYWIAIALLVDAAQFGWMVPFAVLGLSAYFAIYPAAAAFVLWRSRARGIAAALVLAVAWTVAEWLRGYVLSGFPWNLIATMWVDTPTMAQPAAWLGAYGLGLLTVVMAALPVTIGNASQIAGRRWTGVAAAACLLIVWWTGGAIRLSGAEGAAVVGVRLRLVQPDIAQNLKWDPARVEQNLRDSVALTQSPGFETRTHVVWSESAAPFDLSNDASLREALADAVVPAGGLLMTGALRANRVPGAAARVWNSLYAIDEQGGILGTFDKFHLVPFGEYVPLRGYLGFAKVTRGSVDFSTGPGVMTMTLPGLPKVSPLICYEIIFPGHVVNANDRPGWILNVTNDAWFGISSGPYQHFAAARLRAVEEGLPVVRSANNGISGVIDAYGRVKVSLGLGRRGVVDADLPDALEPTLYARFGDWLVLLLGATVLLVVGPLKRRDRRPRQGNN